MPELCDSTGCGSRCITTTIIRRTSAKYAGDEALITIDTLDVMGGELPSRALGLVYEWAGKHRAELREAWTRAKNVEPTGKIEPLE